MSCVFQTMIYGGSQPLVNACEHLSYACQELANACEEEYNPLYLPIEKCCCWGTLNFYSEYLWWRVFQNGLHYAVTGVEDNVPAPGKLFAFNGDWDTGFCVGGEIVFPNNAWKVTLNWLRFRNKDNQAVIEDGLVLRATRGEPGGIDTLLAAMAQFQFKLDTLRLSLQTPLFTRAHVVIKPMVGIRTDWISENFGVVYEATGTNDGTFNNTFQYWGIGPEGGVEANWYLLPCFSVYGQTAIAGLYGKYNVHQEQFASGRGEDINVRINNDRLQTTLATIVGVQWEGCFFRNIFLALRLGWETHFWVNLNTTLLYTDARQEGSLVDTSDDLRTSGVTLRAAVAF